jgi:hypothetical protein
VVKIYLFCYYSPIICLAPPKKRVPTPPFGREMAEVGWINAVQSVSYNHTAASTLPRHRWSPNYSLIVPSGRQKWYHRYVIYGITLHFASQQLGKKGLDKRGTISQLQSYRCLYFASSQMVTKLFAYCSFWQTEMVSPGRDLRNHIAFCQSAAREKELPTKLHFSSRPIDKNIGHKTGPNYLSVGGFFSVFPISARKPT